MMVSLLEDQVDQVVPSVLMCSAYRLQINIFKNGICEDCYRVPSREVVMWVPKVPISHTYRVVVVVHLLMLRKR